jgi:hypothetical protein
MHRWTFAVMCAAALSVGPSALRAQEPPHVGVAEPTAHAGARRALPKPVAPGLPSKHVAPKTGSLTMTYVMLVSGKPAGEIKTVVTREKLGTKDIVHVASTTTSDLQNGTSEMAFGAPEFTPIFSRTNEKAGDLTITTDYRYDGTRVKGSMTGVKGEKKEIDAAVPANTLLPGMEEFAIWGADLSQIQMFKAELFNPATGKTETVTFTNTGVQTLKIGGQDMEAYRIEMSGGAIGMVLFARKDAPHAILKQEYLGEPLSIVLISVT